MRLFIALLLCTTARADLVHGDCDAIRKEALIGTRYETMAKFCIAYPPPSSNEKEGRKLTIYCQYFREYCAKDLNTVTKAKGK